MFRVQGLNQIQTVHLLDLNGTTATFFNKIPDKQKTHKGMSSFSCEDFAAGGRSYLVVYEQGQRKKDNVELLTCERLLTKGGVKNACYISEKQ